MAIQIPEDLEALQDIATTYPSTPATVFIEPGQHPRVESGELPILHLDIEDENTYVHFHAFQDASSESLTRAMTMAGVVTQLRQLATEGMERELFWVSGFHSTCGERNGR